MSRRSRARHADRRAQNAKPPAVSPPRPTPAARPPANRGTFRVAQANRILASEIPDIVGNSTRGRQRQGAAERSPSADSLATAPLARAIPPKPAKPVKNQPKPNTPDATPSQLGMDQPLPKCKTRPDGNKRRAAGAGPSAAWKPWC